MKTHYFLSVKPVLLLLISSGCFMFSCTEKSEKAKNDLSEMKLRGKVKTLTEITHDGVNRSGEFQKGERQSTRIRLFNEDGYLIEDAYFDSFLSLWNKSTYKYDDKGRLTELKRMNNEGEPMSKTTYIYDEKGRILEQIRMDYIVHSQEKEIYKYSEDGKEVEMEFRLFGGLEPTVYTLNVIDGKTIKEDSRRMINRYRKEIYKYDETGNKIEEKHYTSGGNLTTRWLFKYDGSGNLTETEVFDSDDSLIWKNIFKYDLMGNEIERKSGYSVSDPEVVKSCRYDKMGNIIEEIHKYDNRFSKTVYSYNKFDEAGNWLTGTISYILTNTGDEELHSVFAREIEYY